MSLTDALNTIRSIGTMDELNAAEPIGRLKNNSHIHLPPNFSAFESVEQAVALADEQDVRAIGVSNYYDYSVYEPFVALCGEKGIFPAFGLEIISLIDELVAAGVLINDPSNPGRCYICGKGIVGFAEPNERAAELLGIIRRNDTERMREMTAKVSAIFAAAGLKTGIDDAAVVEMIVERHRVPAETVTIQERHIAMAFQRALFAAKPEGERLAVLEAAFGKAPKSAADDAVGIQGEIRSAPDEGG